jgi:PIN domain nuclease of toxin-antitoxin system
VGWELAIKVNRGKMNALPLVTDIALHIRQEGFFDLPITMEHATRAGLLALHHRDPFDRLLAAQAQSLNMPVISADAILDRYDIKRLW